MSKSETFFSGESIQGGQPRETGWFEGRPCTTVRIPNNIPEEKVIFVAGDPQDPSKAILWTQTLTTEGETRITFPDCPPRKDLPTILPKPPRRIRSL